MKKYLIAAAFSTALTVPAAAQTPDCGLFYMGSGGYIFAQGITYQMNQFKARYPRAAVSLHHYWADTGSGSRCKNPVYVGHSMGADRAMVQADHDKKGRVVSIDPPSWKYGSELNGGRGHYVSRPTVHLYQCSAEFGCGRVTGPNVKKYNLTGRNFAFTHGAVAFQPEVTRAVLTGK